ncbi:hypothetical protein MTP99_017418 [Tenebrio molitor]|jgi:hypothetical protein|nr:hypothetical protein MTP99_017418 [Tenebrio molitor]
MIKVVVVVLSFGVLAVSGLRCYNCDPTDVGSCIDPEKNNIKLTTCEGLSSAKGIRRLIPQPKININDDSVVYECISLYFTADENSVYGSGMYRGCSVRSSTSQSTCDSLTQDSSRLGDGATGSVSDCKACTEDACNKGGTSAASSLTVAVVAVVSTAYALLLNL